MGFFENMTDEKKMKIFGAILLVAVAIPIWMPLSIPMGITYTTQGFYDAIEELPEGSIVVMGWMGMKFEQYAGQETAAAAIWKHAHSKGLRLVCLSLGSLSPLFFEDIYERNNLVELYDLEYGVDYVITPYLSGEETAVAAFAEDVWGALSTDLYNTPFSELPLMQEVHSLVDFDLCFMTSYSFTSYDYFIRQWGWAYDKPLIQALHSFTPIAYAYPWPVTGCLDGDRGNAEYEFMTGNLGDSIARYNSRNTQSIAWFALLVIGWVTFKKGGSER